MNGDEFILRHIGRTIERMDAVMGNMVAVVERKLTIVGIRGYYYAMGDEKKSCSFQLLLDFVV